MTEQAGSRQWQLQTQTQTQVKLQLPIVFPMVGEIQSRQGEIRWFFFQLLANQ